MDARLQRRVQRYGWDLAAPAYEALWQAQLAPAQAGVLALAALCPGEQVLDVACGTGLVSLPAADAVGVAGRVVGTDLSGKMLLAAQQETARRALSNLAWLRMDAEQLELSDASFDAALCALGLMYIPEPLQAVREMRRVLRPGGRAAFAVWGRRRQCGWSTLFPIVDAEVASEVCPLFFRLGEQDALARLCAEAGFEAVQSCRITVTLEYADPEQACAAAFAGGPVALAWSRFDEAVRARVCEAYLESIAPWRHGDGYRIPGEFMLVLAHVPGAGRATPRGECAAAIPA